MAGRLGQRPLLAPAGHAAIHQRRIALEAHLGPQAEPLHHTRAHAFDQRIGAVDQREHGSHRGRIFQVERQRLLAAMDDGILAQVERVAGLAAAALDQDDLGAHIGQQHAAKRGRADTGDFNDAITR